MKNIYYIILLTIVCGFTSCDYLDQKPENLKDEEQIWSTRADAEAYLYNIYGYISQATDATVYLGFADESSCSMIGVPVRNMIKGNWGPSNNADPFNNWSRGFEGIRKSLIFEKNIGRIPDEILSQELKKQYVAEAKFLRGWYYWTILRMFGPFPIFEDLMSTTDDFDKIKRAPFDKCVDHICGLMQDAMVLPDEWTVSSNLGRPTRGAALAVISEVRLLAASELWNGNPRFKDFKNQDGEHLAPLEYDPEKWRLAAEAAEDLIKTGTYHLYRNDIDGGDPSFDPYISFRDVFLTNNNPELIFATYQSGTWQWGHDKRCNPKPGGYAMSNATQNIVDAFYTNKGLDKEDDIDYTEIGFAANDDNRGLGSVRNEQGGYSKGESNMYVNREPRFYASVHYNARPVISAISVDNRNLFSSYKNKNGKGRAEYYYSGLSGASQNLSDFTGYNIAKGVSPAADIYHDANIYRPFIHIRYAQILLNYIEAMNEYNPEDTKIIVSFR